MIKRIIGTYELRILLIAAGAAGLAIIALCFTLVFRINQTQQFKQQSVENCEHINLVKVALLGQVNDEEDRVLGLRERTPAEVEAIRDYYERQRARYQPDECPTE